MAHTEGTAHSASATMWWVEAVRSRGDADGEGEVNGYIAIFLSFRYILSL